MTVDPLGIKKHEEGKGRASQREPFAGRASGRMGEFEAIGAPGSGDDRSLLNSTSDARMTTVEPWFRRRTDPTVCAPTDR